MSADINIVCAYLLQEILNQTELFCKNRSEKSDMCKYSDIMVILAAKLQNLIAADKEDNRKGHLQSLQDLLSIF